jgi:hypothetical protein
MENDGVKDELDSGSTEALIAEYDRKRKNRADDVIATQAVVCILLAALLVGGRIFRPEITGEVFGRIKSLATDTAEIMPNPIDILIDHFDKAKDMRN